MVQYHRRRKEGKDVYGFTFKLLTTSDGVKMGKTLKGAVFLDPKRTSPYEFFQYWRNIEDVKVEECLGLLTFLPMDEVRRLGAYKDEKINEAKEVLAYEITKIVHGKEEADKALEAARAVFAGGGKSANMPSSEVKRADLQSGLELMGVLVDTKLCTNRSDARRMIEQGGVSVNDNKVSDIKAILTVDDLDADGEIVIKKGKKSYHRLTCVD